MDKRKIYSELCDLMDHALKKSDVCALHRIKTTKKLIITCYGQQYPRMYQIVRRINTLCCGGNYFDSAKPGKNVCKHHSKNGCRVKSLGCKTWLCIEALARLQTLSPAKFLSFMQTREYVLQQIRQYNIPCMPKTSKKDNFKSK